MTREALINKINKLLALADTSRNNSEAEAQAAYAKAQALIAEYNLNMDELNEDKEQIVLMPATHSNNEGYRTRLAMVLAQNFRCRVIMVGNRVNFIGYKTDAEVCVKVFNSAYRLSHNKGLKLEREARKTGLSTRGVANSYWIGFCNGLKEVLDEQCRALMIIVPDEVNKELKERAGGTYRGGMRNTGMHSEQYMQGRQDGRDHMKAHYIEG